MRIKIKNSTFYDMFSECTHKTHLFFQLYTLRNDKSGMMLLHKHVTLENVKKSNREVEPKKKQEENQN